MMMDTYQRRLTQVVTLHLRSAGVEDDHGNPTATVVDEVTVGFASRHIPTEANQGEVVGEQYRLHLPAETSLTGWDSVLVEGIGDCEVIGTPWEVFNPRLAVVHHVECDIRRAGTSG